MLHDLRLEEEFFAMLEGFDAEIAGRVAAAGCPHCGGPLYQANYERKPRGAKIAAPGEAFTLRHSLCCGREGCRKRAQRGQSKVAPKPQFASQLERLHEAAIARRDSAAKRNGVVAADDVLRKAACGFARSQEALGLQAAPVGDLDTLREAADRYAEADGEREYRNADRWLQRVAVAYNEG